MHPLFIGHTAPFGNWGVDTESSGRRDGHQFQGWCHNRRLCDNNGDCDDYCEDDWHEWNSCTSDLSEYSPPNDEFYNHADGWQQKSTEGTNTHGAGRLNLVVDCPVDTDGATTPTRAVTRA